MPRRNRLSAPRRDRGPKASPPRCKGRDYTTAVTQTREDGRGVHARRSSLSPTWDLGYWGMRQVIMDFCRFRIYRAMANFALSCSLRETFAGIFSPGDIAPAAGVKPPRLISGSHMSALVSFLGYRASHDRRPRSRFLWKMISKMAVHRPHAGNFNVAVASPWSGGGERGAGAVVPDPPFI